MKHKKLAEELYQLVGTGQILDAFEKFYDEKVEMQELGQEPRVGKTTNREYEQNFVGSIQEVHGGGVDSITCDEEKGITMVESWMDLTFKNGQRVKMEQVAVQHWKNGLIIREKFYHN